MLIIPAIDLIDGKCVRLLKGDYEQRTTYSRNPVGQALRFQSAGFRRLHLVDLEGARDGEGKNREAIQTVIKASRVPVQVGGGIRSVDDVEELIAWGASWLILGTMVLEDPDEVSRWVERWGGERFAVSLDLRAGKLQKQGWLAESSQDLKDVTDTLIKWGVHEVICTDVDSDGTLEEPNWSAYELLLDLLPADLPLVAAGGICEPGHIARLADLGVSGAIVGRALYEGNYTWEEMLSAG
jgi:phosphoribosylformimino-5-aminoimidazole carboxamide ribotide isomerase